MSLEEKIGQLNQVGPSLIGAFEVPTEELLNMMADGKLSQEEAAGIMERSKFGFPLNEIKEGKVGSCNGGIGMEALSEAQRAALQSRMGIPLLFGADVIHGYMTIYPIPLALSGSFEPELFRRTAEMAADEASCVGIHWTFGPMIDVARDARWGRISEGAGEDPYLVSVYAENTIKGFQGEDISDGKHVIACAKHFAAYGGAEAGRDYNSSDMSEQKLREVYLPPFEAAVKAGVGTLMPAFNDISGVPCLVNKGLLSDILREEWGFDGFLISDANAIPECINHGVAFNRADAARQALQAGVDMDMASGVYVENLKGLTESGEVVEAEINKAVRNVLRLKFALGIMENPFRTDEERMRTTLLKPEYQRLAKEAAEKSIVLLKNNGVLPLHQDQRVTLIGKLAEDKSQMIGAWVNGTAGQYCISVKTAMEMEHHNFSYVSGVDKEGHADEKGILDACTNSDIIVIAMGEDVAESGEAASRGELSIHKLDKEILRIAKNTGKPVVLLLFNGRPLIIAEETELADAVLECWHPGTQAGPAITGILYGKVNPSARITATFPAATGQCPIYYNHMNTGRPAGQSKYTSKYIDIPTEPLFPFGFGLSFTTFEYNALQAKVDNSGFHVCIQVKNTGRMAGDEIVQVYLQDVVANRARPVKELKAFKRIHIESGEIKVLSFKIPLDSMAYYDRKGCQRLDEGIFRVYVGGNSRDTLVQNVNYRRM